MQLLQHYDSVTMLTNRLNGVVSPPPPPEPRIGRKHANVTMHASNFGRAAHLGGDVAPSRSAAEFGGRDSRDSRDIDFGERHVDAAASQPWRNDANTNDGFNSSAGDVRSRGGGGGEKVPMLKGDSRPRGSAGDGTYAHGLRRQASASAAAAAAMSFGPGSLDSFKLSRAEHAPRPALGNRPLITSQPFGSRGSVRSMLPPGQQAGQTIREVWCTKLNSFDPKD